MKVKNAKSLPEIYYGLHMVEGTAEYSEAGKEPYRIYIGETTIKNMNPTFQGKPVYVDHVDEVVGVRDRRVRALEAQQRFPPPVYLAAVGG